MTFSSNAPNIVLVEGTDDLHAIAGLLKQFDLTKLLGRGGGNTLNLEWNESNEKVDIISAGGIEEVKDFNRTLEKLENLSGERDNNKLALIVDSDEDHLVCWKSVRNRLIDLGYSVPEKPSSDGTVVSAPKPRMMKIGLWLMPDNRSQGMLEDFLAYCVPNPKESLTWQTSQESTASVKNNVPEADRFRDIHDTKARIHAYLAWQNPPGSPLGQAIVRGMLDHRAEIAKCFLRWLCNVFEFEIPKPLAAS